MRVTAVAVNRFAPGEYPQPPEGVDPTDFEGPSLVEMTEPELTREIIWFVVS